MKQKIILPFFILTAYLSYGQKEHLNPARDFGENKGLLKDYYDNVFPLLYRGFNAKPYARYTAMPSFSTEYAFSVETKDNKYLIISHTLSENYWYSKKRKKVRLISNEIEIDQRLYRKIGELFQILSEQTKKPVEDEMGCDGKTYYFHTIYKGKVTIGETWSPSTNSILDRVVQVCNNLFAMGNEEDISQSNFEKEIEKLITELKK